VGGSVAHLHLDALRVRNSVNSLDINKLTTVKLIDNGQDVDTVEERDTE
jgi:hypothetical protein